MDRVGENGGATLEKSGGKESGDVMEGGVERDALERSFERQCRVVDGEGKEVDGEGKEVDGEGKEVDGGQGGERNESDDDDDGVDHALKDALGKHKHRTMVLLIEKQVEEFVLNRPSESEYVFQGDMSTYEVRV